MRSGSFKVLASTLLVLVSSPLWAAGPHVHHGPTSPRSHTKAAPKNVTVSGIDSERATQIQTALIKQGYLSGTPSGAWDSETQTAMTRLQADNGWQTKLVPDSRAIIHLGLGPKTEVAGVTESPEASLPVVESSGGSK